MDFIKKIPLPIWIGLGMVLILIVVMANRQSSNSQQSSTVAGGGVTQTAGPVTTDTVGTQGAQAGAGTDQELGNISQMYQSGFSQIAAQEQTNTALLSSIASGMTPGVGTSMQQFGGAIQGTQNSSAANNAVGGTPGQNAGNNPSAMPVPSTASG